MKARSFILIICFVSLNITVSGQGVAIKDDNSAPNVNVILDIDAVNNDKGILIPRLTTDQRLNMGDLDMAEDGLLVYDEITKSFWHWIGFKWKEIQSGNTRLVDTDLDTEVKVEESADEDVIRFYVEGQQKMVLTRNSNDEARLELPNNSGSMFFGLSSGDSNKVAGVNNLGIGNYTLFANTSGIKNIAIGENALSANKTGSFNIAIGEEALLLSSGASSNTAIGLGVLRANTTGANNIGLGPNALRLNTEGSDNVVIGNSAMLSSSTGNHNIVLGSNALKSNLTGSGNIAIGTDALSTVSAPRPVDIIAIGKSTLENCKSTLFTTVVGTEALRNNTNSFANTVFGNRAMEMDTTGNSNTAVGSYTMRFAQASLSTAVGQASLFYATGYRNSVLGWHAMQQNTTGDDNTAVGSLALDSMLVGSSNAALGYKSGNSSGEKSNCSFLGSYARSTAGLNIDNSTALGYEAMVTADHQVRVGNTNVTSIGGVRAWTNLSDGRFKSNIKENVPGLEFIQQLRPVTYILDIEKYNDFLGIHDSSVNKNRNVVAVQTGFVAQEVQAIAEGLGYEFSGVDIPTNENSVYGLRYAEFVAPIIKAIQEQQQMITELRNENASLRDRLTLIEKSDGPH